MRILENIRYVIFDNAARQAFCNGSFPHARLADQQRIIFTAAAQGLDDAFQLRFAPDQRVNFSCQCQCVQINCVLFQCAIIACGLFSCSFPLLWRRIGLGVFTADTVDDVIDDIQSADIALSQKMHRMRILFTKQRGENIRAGDFLFVGRLRVQNGALDDALKPEGGLRVHFAIAGNNGGVAVYKFRDNLAQLFYIRVACT